MRMIIDNIKHGQSQPTPTQSNSNPVAKRSKLLSYKLRTDRRYFNDRYASNRLYHVQTNYFYYTREPKMTSWLHTRLE